MSVFGDHVLEEGDAAFTNFVERRDEVEIPRVTEELLQPGQLAELFLLRDLLRD